MSLYVLILDTENSTIWDNVKEYWPSPSHHIHDDRVAFIKDDKLLTGEISDKAGIKKEGSPGIVVQIEYYSGFSSLQLVEWLDKQSG